MESSIKSFFAMLQMLFMSVINVVKVVNNFALAGVIRSDVITDNAASDAALSQLKKRSAFALELDATKKELPDKQLLKAADEYIQNWKLNSTIQM